MQQEVKTCTRCKIEKPIEEFYLRKDFQNGRTSRCKECHKAIFSIWKISNPDRDHQWERSHPDKAREMHRRWRSKNKEHINEYARAYSNTIKGRLCHDMTRSIHRSLNGNKNGKHWESIVGFTLDQLKRNLEKQFLIGMSWDNRNEWHIDHKIPISAFNFKTPDDIDFKRCWALKNLQPLWAKENLSKNNKLSQPFQPSLAIAL